MCFFPVFVFFFFFLSVFVLSAPLEMPPPPLSLSPGPPAKEPPSPSPSAAPRQRQSPARTCPEVSGAGKDAGSLRPGGADPAGGEEPSEDAPSQDVPLASGSPVAVRKDSSSCKIGIFRSLGKKIIGCSARPADGKAHDPAKPRASELEGVTSCL